MEGMEELSYQSITQSGADWNEPQKLLTSLSSLFLSESSSSSYFLKS